MKYKELRKQVIELQGKLNIANNTVAKQIQEINKFEKHYESQLKVQDKELSRRLTIIHYLEDILFNRRVNEV